MSITNYTDLQTEVIANSGRSDLTSSIPTFIQLAEAEMKRKLRVIDLHSTSNITVTAGTGSLPSDYSGTAEVYWDLATDVPLRFLSRSQYEYKRQTLNDGDPIYYTIQGTSIKVLPEDTGTAVMAYIARLTALSVSNATNAIITNYPDAYFFGTLKYLYHHTRNWEAKAQQAAEFDRAIDQIIRDSREREYPDLLTVRAQ